ncbi:energy-coupling factor transporter ATPase [Clostridia bacterium]|nr:energy-coupling factor transporter ATPase [Clostridia bacterium]
MLEAKNIDYYYEKYNENSQKIEKVFAIKEMDLTIAEGEFLVILGKNGSGKSTFSRLCNALLTPTSGILYVDNIDTLDEEKVYEIREKVGVVFQNPDNQIISTKVEDDVAFGPENLNLNSLEIRNRVDYAVSLVGIDQIKNASTDELSIGQKQKVSLAGVLAMKPQYIILDEPTSMQDPKSREDIMNVLKQIRQKSNVTIVLVTHYMEEVIDADRVVVMDESKVRMSGTPREIFSRAKKVREYGLELPRILQISNKLREKGVKISKTILTNEELVEELCRLG